MNGAQKRYFKDGHGNVVGLATMNISSLLKFYEYDVFGVEIDKDESDVNPFRYCGEYYDNELDKIYLRARYYTPAQGRFMTEDPIRDGVNWYGYCSGNPVRFVDPSGLINVPKKGTETLNELIDSLMEVVYYKVKETIGDSVGSETKNAVKVVEGMISEIETFSPVLANEIKDVVINANGDFQDVSALVVFCVEIREYIVNNVKLTSGKEVVSENKSKEKINYYKQTGDVYVADIINKKESINNNIDRANDVKELLLPNSESFSKTDLLVTGTSSIGYWVKILRYDYYKLGLSDTFNHETEDVPI